MTQLAMFSHRFERNIRLTHHVHDRMAKRDVSEAMLLDPIETGEVRHKSETEIWIFKRYPERQDTLVCAAVSLTQAVVVKTVMVDWKLVEI